MKNVCASLTPNDILISRHFHLVEECEVKPFSSSLPTHCKTQRRNEIEENRKFFQLTSDTGKPSIRFPLYQKFPWLNQSIPSVRYHFAFDDVDSKWMNILNYTKEISLAAAREKMKKLPRKWDSVDVYKKIWHMNNKQMKVGEMCYLLYYIYHSV